MEIVRKRETHESIEYERRYEWKNQPGGGFSFPCDKVGFIDIKSLEPPAIRNLMFCLDGTYEIYDLGIVDIKRTWVEPAVGKCPCGNLITLEGFTNTCFCGADYNWNGTRLSPRSTWGEETEEHPADILNIK